MLGVLLAAPSIATSDQQREGAVLEYLFKWGEPGTWTGQFRAIRGIVAYDREGIDRPIIVVADGGRDLLRSYTWDLMFIDKWGGKGTQPGEFHEPRGIAIDAAGNVVVADALNHRVQKTVVGTKTFLDRPGAPVTHFGSKGSAEGQFNTPTGVAVDASGAIFVVDTENHRVQKFDGNGKFVLAWGKRGSAAGQFYLPSHIAIAKDGRIFVSDTGNNRVQVFDASTKHLASMGRVGSVPGSFAEPKGLAIDRHDNLWVVDRRNHRLQKFSPTGQLLGTFGRQGPKEGEFSFPEDLTFDSTGRLYVTDGMNGRIQVFKPT